MSRTYRNPPKKHWRHPKTGTLKRQTGLLSEAAETARDYGVELSGGADVRRPHSIPDVYEDIAPNYWRETPQSKYPD